MISTNDISMFQVIGKGYTIGTCSPLLLLLSAESDAGAGAAAVVATRPLPCSVPASGCSTTTAAAPALASLSARTTRGLSGSGPTTEHLMNTGAFEFRFCIPRTILILLVYFRLHSVLIPIAIDAIDQLQ